LIREGFHSFLFVGGDPSKERFSKPFTDQYTLDLVRLAIDVASNQA
jgi:5,10-methylenetetrahydrofolate reductase